MCIRDRDKAVIYIHGKGGNAEEAIHYKPLFSNCDVIGLDYTAQFPWEAKEEFPLLFNSIYRNYKTVEVIANSIGAYFAINALSNQQIEKAYFISPVVDMERLIADMMIWANVTEDELKEKKEIQTTFGAVSYTHLIKQCFNFKVGVNCLCNTLTFMSNNLLDHASLGN